MIAKPLKRCVVYTRKSTDEGMDQDFTSIDAQIESGCAYIASQQHEGWVLQPDRIDDP
ncbi:MAG: recombinase family protein, partial [Gemmataceae bacterium]